MKTELQNFIDMLDNADVNYLIEETELNTIIEIGDNYFHFDNIGRLLIVTN